MTAPATPAFPCLQSPGMTLRQWYAGQALAGILSRAGSNSSSKIIATAAVETADAMIAALKEADDA